VDLVRKADRASWGRVLRVPHQVACPAFRDQIDLALRTAGAMGIGALAVGLGRSYGDSNLNPDGALIDMRRIDRFIAFDPTTGVLRAEAGLSLGQIIRTVVPQGWFLPTTPGTRFVTLGGAIANDVHGKNHLSAGSFGCHVRRIGMLRSDRGLIEISPMQEPDLFYATIGGLGLTGVMVWAEIQLTPITTAWIEEEVLPMHGLDDFFTIADGSDGFEHTVSWIDCTAGGRSIGRGVFVRGAWSKQGRLDVHEDQVKISLPFDAPGWALNSLTLRAFNAFYWRQQRWLRPSQGRAHYSSHFYPLDAIGDWNRLYGRRGFFQYQSVVPPAAGLDATREMLATIARSGDGSFLAVLKTLGARASGGLLSFPREGVTLALDFANRGEKTFRLLARLDDIVRAAGGRLYPAKDGRLPWAMFEAGYPGLPAFSAYVDPALTSHFWARMTPPQGLRSS
jgi:L-gulonolactone oxidase